MPSILTAALLICFIPAVQAPEGENPYRKAKVGDWVDYKMTGPNMQGSTKMTVVAKDDKELTYQVAGKFAFNGSEMVAPIQKLKIDLVKSYDPVIADNMKQNDVKFEKLGEGTEKIKIGDKEYDTKWTKMRTTSTVNGVTVVGEYKMWFCKDVPLSGMVRMETETGGFPTKLELVGSGGK